MTSNAYRETASTGIVELDNILGGGFPRRSMILVSGNPGCGKTIFSTQFLYHGASNCGEKGVYVSFAENRTDYYQNMLHLGMNVKGLEEKGLFKFMDFPNMDKDGMKAAINMVVEEVSQFGAKRLAVDSITAILQAIGRNDTRRFLHVLFGRLVKDIGVTTIIVGEIPFGKKMSGSGIEEFVSDGVIFLRSERTEDIEKKELFIAKMRGVSLDRSSFEYIIDERSGGITIVALPTRSNIEEASRERLSIGVKGLDMMLHGGLYRDSITLIEGAGGIGKTTLCLHFLAHSAKKGEKALLISFEEPVGQIKRMLEDYGIDYKQFGESFNIQSYVPEALTPLYNYKLIKDIIESYHPTVLAIDSITGIQHVFPEKDFLQLMRHLQILCKERRLTVLLTSTLGTLEAATRSGVSTLADNIILMRYYELKDKMAREMIILKTRGAPHEKRLMTFEITPKGMVVYA